MSGKRYERITILRAPNFTSYGVYDNEQKVLRVDLMSSCDVDKINVEIKRLNKEGR